MSMGFGLLMTLGVASSCKLRTLGGGPERVRAIWAHAACQTGAVAFALGGFGAIYRNKAIKGKEHFTTTHGKVGLLAMALTVLAMLLGGGAFARLGLLARLPEPVRPAVKWAHRKLGALAWAAGILAVMLALPHPAVFRAGGVTLVWQGCVVVAAACVAYMLAAEPTAATAAPGRFNKVDAQKR
jgi:cytochrome b-561 domain-containing protein 2